ncbi:MAG: bifunctional riboflavin kinase/FAD synthetase [Bacteroidota bacterium]
MKVYRSLEEFEPLANAVVTQGTFDGVHIGHQKIIDRVRNIAAQKGGESVLLTFFPHPRMVLQPDDNTLRLLSTTEEKIERLRKAGIDHLLVIPFTLEFSCQSSMQFVRDVLVNTIGVKTLVIGYDHRFGKNREGSMEDLHELGQVYDFDVEEIPPQDIDDVTVSSTKIRNALQEGEVDVAAKYLGYHYPVSGKVVAGNSLGKTIGFPTANIVVEETYKLIPNDGVYAVRVIVDGEIYGGMANMGKQPTFDNRNHAFEVHIFDFNADIYGRIIRVEFVAHLRSEMKFSGVDALIAQLKQDENTARNVLTIDENRKMA